MGFGAVALVDVPVHTRHRVVELVRYVYAKYSQLLSPPAYALITYHSEMPGECWLNMFDRRYVMVSCDFCCEHQCIVKYGGLCSACTLQACAVQTLANPQRMLITLISAEVFCLLQKA